MRTDKKLQAKQYPQPSDEALARAVLTFCADSPDAILYATLLGANSAIDLVESIRAIPEFINHNSNNLSTVHSGPLNQLEEMFIQGSASWGHQASRQDLKKFHASLVIWKERLQRLPDIRSTDLTQWATHDGAYWIITPEDRCWPEQLSDLALRSDWAPPLCIWGLGSQEALISCSDPIAVVGSRVCNEYGRHVAHHIALKCAAQGHLVVSGGATGIDASAHWGALTAGQSYEQSAGKTISVFAGGLNTVGPKSNHRLFKSIVQQGGTLISELCPSTIPKPHRFLMRNRIIAALARVVVVAQARHRSGALNTANWAAELNREIYAAPGPINNPENTGCNRLIHDGKAMILISATDASNICHPEHENNCDSSSSNLTSSQHLPDQPSFQQERLNFDFARNTYDDRKLTQPKAYSKPIEAASSSNNIKKNLPRAYVQILTGVEQCRQLGITPTSDQIRTLLTQDSDLEISTQSIARNLGAMELEGLIRIANGIVQIL